MARMQPTAHARWQPASDEHSDEVEPQVELAASQAHPGTGKAVLNRTHRTAHSKMPTCKRMQGNIWCNRISRGSVATRTRSLPTENMDKRIGGDSPTVSHASPAPPGLRTSAWSWFFTLFTFVQQQGVVTGVVKTRISTASLQRKPPGCDSALAHKRYSGHATENRLPGAVVVAVTGTTAHKQYNK